MLIPNQQTQILGRLKFGKPHSFTYTLANVSDKPVTISRLVVGCQSCTTAKMGSRTIGAGQSEDIQVTFTPGSLGNHTKALDVVYDGGVMKLLFKAEVYDDKV